MATKPKAKIFKGATEAELTKIRKDYPDPPFTIETTKLNGTYDVRVTKKK